MPLAAGGNAPFSLTDIDYIRLQIMTTSYIMYDILKPSMIWKVGKGEPLTSFLVGPRMVLIRLCSNKF